MIKVHTIPYNFIIRNSMEPSRRLFFISLGAADVVTYDSHEVSFPTPFCQENVIIWKQTSHDRVGRCFLRSRNQDRGLRDWKGGPDPVFPLLFHENPAVSRIQHTAIYIYFFKSLSRIPLFFVGFFRKSCLASQSAPALGTFSSGVLRNLLPFWGAPLCSCWITHEMMFEIFQNKW